MWFVCQSDEFAKIAKGQRIQVKDGRVLNEQGEDLDCDTNYISTSPEDFAPELELTKTDKPVKKESIVKKYALVKKLTKTYDSVDDVVKATKRIRVSSDVYVVEIVGKVEIVKNMKFIPVIKE